MPEETLQAYQVWPAAGLYAAACCTPIVDWGRKITTALSQFAMLHTTEARFHHVSPEPRVPEPKVCAGV